MYTTSPPLPTWWADTKMSHWIFIKCWAYLHRTPTGKKPKRTFQDICSKMDLCLFHVCICVYTCSVLVQPYRMNCHNHHLVQDFCIRWHHTMYSCWTYYVDPLQLSIKLFPGEHEHRTDFVICKKRHNCWVAQRQSLVLSVPHIKWHWDSQHWCDDRQWLMYRTLGKNNAYSVINYLKTKSKFSWILVEVTNCN